MDPAYAGRLTIICKRGIAYPLDDYGSWLALQSAGALGGCKAQGRNVGSARKEAGKCRASEKMI